MSRATRRLGWTLLVLSVLLIAGRIVAPYVALHYVNRELADLNGYAGHVGDLKLALWRGAYQLREVRVVKEEGAQDIPLFYAPRINLSTDWSALFRGALVAGIDLDRPQINIVAEAAPQESGETKQEKVQEEKAIAHGWQKKARGLFPFQIDHVAIHGGEVHFRNPHTDPVVDLYVREINGALENLTNTAKIAGDLTATAHFTGLMMGSGRLGLDLSANPYAASPTFDLTAKLEELQLSDLNELLRSYAYLDAEAGRLSVYTKVTSQNGRFRGFVKPFMEEARFVDWKHEQESFFTRVWESIAQAATNLLENRKTEQVATVVPLQGRITSPNADIWTTVVLVLRNAFVQALAHGFQANLPGRR